jgi:hypothetical protein
MNRDKFNKCLLSGNTPVSLRNYFLAEKWGMTANVRRLGEGCLTESSNFAQCFWQLLPNRCYVLGGLSAQNLI